MEPNYSQSLRHRPKLLLKILNMKTLVLVAFVALVGVVCARPSEEHYTDKFDNIDLDQILQSERLLQNYFKCLMDKGTCTPDGTELKNALPDALHSECSKCTEKQKTGARKVIHFLIDNKRDWWDELEAKYDKEGTYRKKYEAEIKKEGLKI